VPEQFLRHGWRVYNSSGSLSYLLDPSGQLLGGAWSGGGQNSAIRLGSRMLAQYQSNGADFTHVNPLGSETQNTDYAGNGGQAILYYPWGQVWQNPSGGYPNSFYQIFASLQLYDTSTDGYVPPFRYYIPEQSRWLTPDPLGGDVTNSQSLNRYAYALNNPTTLIDPLGLDPCDRNPDSRACNHDPHFNDAFGSGGDGGGSCYIDGIQSNCGVAFQIINAGSGGTTVRSAGGFLTFQVPIPSAEEQSSLFFEGQSIGGGSTDYPDSFYTVSIPIGGDSSFSSGSLSFSGFFKAYGSPQTPTQTACSTGSPNNHLSMGDSASVSTVNPFTSGNGGVWGANRQSFPATTNNYTYSGKGVGLDVGASVQSVWAWGSGSWSGPFHSINVSAGPFAGSIFWTPGKGGWTGFSFGLGVGLPIPQAAYEVTNYTCRSGS